MAVMFLWTGQSLVSVSVYARDAIAMQLPLISDGALHDWHYLLLQINLLDQTPVIANLILMLGWLMVVLAIGVIVWKEILRIEIAGEHIQVKK